MELTYIAFLVVYMVDMTSYVMFDWIYVVDMGGLIDHKKTTRLL